MLFETRFSLKYEVKLGGTFRSCAGCSPKTKHHVSETYD